MSAVLAPTPAAAPTLVPGVWRADVLAHAAQQGVPGAGACQPSGHALLDAQLPGGGWPLGALTEILQPAGGLWGWSLVLPALAAATAARAGAVVLVAPPGEVFAPVLERAGLAAARLCRVTAGSAQQAQWAAEQALRCRDVLAVLAWLPRVQAAALRRLHLAAARQRALLWVFGGEERAAQASPALLRLRLEWPDTRWHAHGDGQGARLRVHLLKRRGPPLDMPLDLPGCDAALVRVLAAQAGRRQARQHEAEATLAALRAWKVAMAADPAGPVHVLDRAALAGH